MVILLMGVAGSGKTTIGKRLSAELGWQFADGDDYHPAANVEKMRNGIPLTDADRAPWLRALRGLVEQWINDGTNGVLACSALKRAYREELKVSDDARVVYLKVTDEVLAARLRRRTNHYMKEGMLQSQLATLEEPDDALVVDASGTVADSVRQIREGLRLGEGLTR